MIISLKKFTSLSLLCFLSSLPVAYASNSLDADIPNGLPDHIVGDIGAAVYSNNLNIGSLGAQSIVLPYGFFDYQRFAMRIDQLAFKTAPPLDLDFLKLWVRWILILIRLNQQSTPK
jgi:outer membrane protein